MTLRFTALALLLTIGSLGFTHAATAKNYITPKGEFLKSVVTVRDGIEDLGETTVSQFVDMIKSSKMDNGQSPTVKGWVKTPDGYALDVVGAKSYRLEFLWTGGGACLLKPIRDGENEVPAMLYVMTLGGGSGN